MTWRGWVGMLLLVELWALQVEAQTNPCRKTKANPANAGVCQVVGATPVVLLATNTSRCGLILANTSANPMVCRDVTDGVPTATEGWRLPPGQWLVLDFEGQQQWQCIRAAAADAEACILEGVLP